ncbi:hypothetical protein FB451DRAFT_1171051 [Mycena latifolia]|nr:hypothetical protein FB451DRAFT_1171051 [Mycena latifolia]
MSLPRRTIALIVGAGPCGMAAAVSLHHQGIHDMVIVDSVLAGENSSRAIVIQAATLEALNTIGCLDKLLSLGGKAERIGLHDGSSYLISADFSLLSQYTKFPFGLVLPQSSTEAVMLETLDQLGIKVLRPFKVVSLKPSQDADHSIDVRFESGEIVQAKFVIGADGAHSVVRHEAGIAFTDPDGDEEHDYGKLSQLALGDVTLSSPPHFPSPDTRMLAAMVGGNFTLLAQFPASVSPDKDHTVYRIVCGVPLEDGTVPHAPSTEYLQSLLDRCGVPALSSDPKINPHPLRIEKTYWSSRYRTRSAIAERCFTRLGNEPDGGAVLLIGDAGHIHSPLGGQGMSLGIRDAISLGPVLKSHIDLSAQRVASDKLLHEWAARRHERALAVVAITKQALSLVTAQGNTWFPLQWLGFSILRFLGQFALVKRMVAYRMSGLAEI